MASRGRQPGFKMPEEHRAKIKLTNILNALTEHVEGTREMSSTQVTAAIALMKKVLPDLQAATIEHTGSIETTSPEQREAAVAAAILAAQADNERTLN